MTNSNKIHINYFLTDSVNIDKHLYNSLIHSTNMYLLLCMGQIQVYLLALLGTVWNKYDIAPDPNKLTFQMDI